MVSCKPRNFTRIHYHSVLTSFSAKFLMKFITNSREPNKRCGGGGMGGGGGGGGNSMFVSLFAKLILVTSLFVIAY